MDYSVVYVIYRLVKVSKLEFLKIHVPYIHDYKGSPLFRHIVAIYETVF